MPKPKAKAGRKFAASEVVSYQDSRKDLFRCGEFEASDLPVCDPLWVFLREQGALGSYVEPEHVDAMCDDMLDAVEQYISVRRCALQQVSAEALAEAGVRRFSGADTFEKIQAVIQCSVLRHNKQERHHLRPTDKQGNNVYIPQAGDALFKAISIHYIQWKTLRHKERKIQRARAAALQQRLREEQEQRRARKRSGSPKTKKHKKQKVQESSYASSSSPSSSPTRPSPKPASSAAKGHAAKSMPLRPSQCALGSMWTAPVAASPLSPRLASAPSSRFPSPLSPSFTSPLSPTMSTHIPAAKCPAPRPPPGRPPAARAMPKPVGLVATTRKLPTPMAKARPSSKPEGPTQQSRRGGSESSSSSELDVKVVPAQQPCLPKAGAAIVQNGQAVAAGTASQALQAQDGHDVEQQPAQAAAQAHQPQAEREAALHQAPPSDQVPAAELAAMDLTVEGKKLDEKENDSTRATGQSPEGGSGSSTPPEVKPEESQLQEGQLQEFKPEDNLGEPQLQEGQSQPQAGEGVCEVPKDQAGSNNISDAVLPSSSASAPPRSPHGDDQDQAAGGAGGAAGAVFGTHGDDPPPPPPRRRHKTTVRLSKLVRGLQL